MSYENIRIAGKMPILLKLWTEAALFLSRSTSHGSRDWLNERKKTLQTAKNRIKSIWTFYCVNLTFKTSYSSDANAGGILWIIINRDVTPVDTIFTKHRFYFRHCWFSREFLWISEFMFFSFSLKMKINRWRSATLYIYSDEFNFLWFRKTKDERVSCKHM